MNGGGGRRFLQQPDKDLQKRTRGEEENAPDGAMRWSTFLPSPSLLRDKPIRQPTRRRRRKANITYGASSSPSSYQLSQVCFGPSHLLLSFKPVVTAGGYFVMWHTFFSAISCLLYYDGHFQSHRHLLD